MILYYSVTTRNNDVAMNKIEKGMKPIEIYLDNNEFK